MHEVENGLTGTMKDVGVNSVLESFRQKSSSKHTSTNFTAAPPPNQASTTHLPRVVTTSIRLNQRSSHRGVNADHGVEDGTMMNSENEIDKHQSHRPEEILLKSIGQRKQR